MPQFRCAAAHTAAINALCIVPQTGFFLSGGADLLVKLHGASRDAEVTLVAFPKEHSGPVNCVSVCKNLFASTSSNVVLWDLLLQQRTGLLYAEGPGRDEILACRFLNDDVLACCGTARNLGLYDLRQKLKTPVYAQTVGRDNLNAIDYCDGSKTVAVASSDGNLYLVDLRNQQLIEQLFVGERGGLMDVQACEDGHLVTFENGTVGVLDKQNHQLQFEVQNSPDRAVYRVNSELVEDYHDTSRRYVFSGSESGSLKIYAYSKTSGETAVVSTLTPAVRGRSTSLLLNIVRFDRSNNRLICSSGDGHVNVWDNVI